MMNSLPLTESQPRLVLKDVAIFNDVLYYGSFGELIKAEWMHAPCAARVVGKVNEDLTSTVELWMGLRHPAIVSLLGLSEVGGTVWMVTERLAANLKILLGKRPKSQFPLAVKSTILHDISSALCYLHSLEPPVPFGDLKADHVYVSEDLRGKLDLGVKITGSDFHTYGNLFESYNTSLSFHVPPDLINPAFANPKLQEKGGSALPAAWDAFSFGVLCLHTLIQETPIPSGHSLECSEGDENAYFHTEIELRSEYINKLADKEKLFLPLIESCLSTIPESRPPLDHILRDVRQICTQMTHCYSFSTAGECYDLQQHLEVLEKEVQSREDELQQLYSQVYSLLDSPQRSHSHSFHTSSDVFSRSEDSSFFIRTSEPDSTSSRTKSLTDPAYYRYKTRTGPGGKVDSLSSSCSSGITSSSNGTLSQGDLLSSSNHFDSSLEDLGVCSKVSDRHKEDFTDINSPLFKRVSSSPDPSTDFGAEDRSGLSSSEQQTKWYKKAIKSPFSRKKKPHSLDSGPTMNVIMQKSPAYEPHEVKHTGNVVHRGLRMPLSPSDETNVEMMQNPSYQTIPPQSGVHADHAYDYIKANGQESARKDMDRIVTANVVMTCNPSYQPTRHHRGIKDNDEYTDL